MHALFLIANGRTSCLAINRTITDVLIFSRESEFHFTMTGFIQARLCKTQGLFKDFSTVFKD